MISRINRVRVKSLADIIEIGFPITGNNASQIAGNGGADTTHKKVMVDVAQQNGWVKVEHDEEANEYAVYWEDLF